MKLSNNIIANWLPERPVDCHKGQAGRVLVIAGSIGYTGAGYLASQAALRTGSGLVTWAMPASLNIIAEIKTTESITRPLPEVSGCLSAKAEKEILKLADRVDVCLLGPGVGQHRETGKLIRRIVQAIEKTVVVDADALNLLAGHLEILKKRKKELIVTPHPGEMSVLINRPVEWIQANRINTARDFAMKYKTVTVLKGAKTVIAGHNGNVYVNTTGNPGMATAGMGDVLAGMIASLIGQGMAPAHAAAAGVYLHGLTGDITAKEIGGIGIIASDLLQRIPKAMEKIKCRRKN